MTDDNIFYIEIGEVKKKVFKHNKKVKFLVN